MVIENVDKAAQSEYYLPFEEGTIGRIGGVEVRDKKAPEKGGFLAEVVEVDPYGYACVLAGQQIRLLTVCVARLNTTRSRSQHH